MSENKAAASYTLPVRVRFSETDAMGIVYHARYFEYLEAARIAMLGAMGVPYPALVAAGFHLPVVEAQIRYRAPAKFDDVLEVQVVMEQMEGVTFTLHYKITRGPTLLAEAQTTHAFINLQGQPVRPPKMFLEKVKGK